MLMLLCPSKHSTRRWLLGLGALSLAACTDPSQSSEPQIGSTIPSFEEFMASLPREPESGDYIVEGDIRVSDEDELYEYYQAAVGGQALTLDLTNSGTDNKYDTSRATNLTFCVSQEFGDDHQAVVDAIQAAAIEWEDASKATANASAVIDFKYLPEYDAEDCHPWNTAIWFDVRPSMFDDPEATYNASAFFPDSPRSRRTVFISPSGLDPVAPKTLKGVLRHELGHTLGFRHEHARANPQPCPHVEARAQREISPYEKLSVMHYASPYETQSADGLWHCKQGAVREYALTDYDKVGVRCIYNPAIDACRGLKLSSTSTQYTGDNNGTLYRLRTASGITYVEKYSGTPGSWTQVSQNLAATAIRAGGSKLFSVAGGNAYYWTAGAWTNLGTAGTQIAVNYASGELFRLTGGAVQRWSGTGTTWNTTGVTAGADTLFPGRRSLYRRDTNGDVYRWTTGTTWTRVYQQSAATTVKMINVVEDNRPTPTLFGLKSDGTVLKWTSALSWTTIGSGAAKLWPNLDGAWISLTGSTNLRRLSGTTWSTFATDVTVFFGAGTRRLGRRSSGELFDYLYP